MRYKEYVILADYLKASGLSDAAFGAQCKPPIHRTSIWHYKKRKRSPSAEHVAAIEAASGYRVRAKDLVRLNGHRSPHKVAHS